jgi:hypothetical protein
LGAPQQDLAETQLLPEVLQQQLVQQQQQQQQVLSQQNPQQQQQQSSAAVQQQQQQHLSQPLGPHQQQQQQQQEGSQGPVLRPLGSMKPQQEVELQSQDYMLASYLQGDVGCFHGSDVLQHQLYHWQVCEGVWSVT